MGKNSFSTSERAGIVYDNGQITVGSLANAIGVVLASKIDSARENGFRVLKTEYWIKWRDFDAGDGTVVVGLAAAQGATNIKDSFEADPQSAGAGDQEALMNTMRPVFPLAVLDAINAAQLNVDAHGVFNMKWSMQEGMNLNWFVFNISGATIATGSNIKFFAKHYGVWLKD